MMICPPWGRLLMAATRERTGPWYSIRLLLGLTWSHNDNREISQSACLPLLTVWLG